MKGSRLVAALALMVGAFSTLDAAALGRNQNRAIHDVDLQDLMANPKTYLDLNVGFRATFVQHADLYAPFHTPFTPERYVNIVVWDDLAELWKPEERAKPLSNLYYSKKQLGTLELMELEKFELVYITGRVVSDYRGEPWIEISGIVGDDSDKPFDDASLHHLQEAKILTDEGRYELAEENFVASLRGQLPYGMRVKVQRNRAENLMLNGRNVLAALVLQDALNVAANFSESELGLKISGIHFLKAKAHASAISEEPALAVQHTQMAIDHAKEAIRLDPTIGEAYAVLGIALANQNQFDEARLRCQRAIRMQPNNAEVRWYLGRILDRQGDFDGAVDALKRAIDLAPKDYRIHKTIAGVYRNRSDAGGPRAKVDLQMSLREYDISIRLNAEDPELYFLSGKVIEKAAAMEIDVQIGSKTVKASPELAVKRYVSCLAIDDAYVPAYVALAQYNRSVGKIDEAIGHYQSALEADPGELALYYELADYAQELGKLDLTYATLEQYAAIVVEDVNALERLAKLSIDFGETEKAIGWYQKILVVQNDGATLLTLAELSDSIADHAATMNYAGQALRKLEGDEAARAQALYDGAKLKASGK